MIRFNNGHKKYYYAKIAIISSIHSFSLTFRRLSVNEARCTRLEFHNYEIKKNQALMP